MGGLCVKVGYANFWVAQKDHLLSSRIIASCSECHQSECLCNHKLFNEDSELRLPRRQFRCHLDTPGALGPDAQTAVRVDATCRNYCAWEQYVWHIGALEVAKWALCWPRCVRACVCHSELWHTAHVVSDCLRFEPRDLLIKLLYVIQTAQWCPPPCVLYG
jgi:hypothetical protein